ncbi:uncharacterized protein LOC111376175 [Olea europaea var. sylvestris]|uniref:uncharacterized protein LOC111376175 n=1 Tax=Olea europaea var. sylvestris TaxID=158386 RepID=UPI000C1CCDEE|nr:uncharacterized protein LOC111376175 [Olea europaea var. sylvestris]
MCFLYICGEQEKELSRQEATGSCPYCGGKVESVDVQTKWSFCFLPLCFVLKRRYICTSCSRRLILDS